MTSEPLKFGLVGTGYWARVAHAPALASADGIQLAAVWGRDPLAAAGKHLLLEKPIALSETDADSLVEAAARPARRPSA
jgi:predicted dehydrogenase